MVDCACNNFTGVNGNVTISSSLLIGPSTAQFPLDVQGGVTRLKGAATDVLHLSASGFASTTTAAVRFFDTNGIARWSFGAGLGGGDDHGFAIYDGLTPALRLHVRPNGNVGIGVDFGAQNEAQHRLDVRGGETRLRGTGTDTLYLDASPTFPTSAIVKFRSYPGSPATALWSMGSGLGGPSDQGFGLYASAGANQGYRLYASLAGNVGVGTTTPLHRLDVQGGTTRLRGLSYEALYVDAPAPPTATPTTALIRFRASDLTNKWMFGMGLAGDDGFGLYGEAGPTPGFRYYALPNGNVGIGTNTPQSVLHVAGTLRTDQNVGIGTAPAAPRLVVRSPNDVAATTIVETRSLNDQVGIGIGYDSIGIVGGVTAWSLNINAKAGGHVTLQTATGVTGNVGIGRTNPVSKLHVQGTFTAEGSITASNGPISTTGGYDITSSGKYYAGSKLIADGGGCYYA